MLTLSTTAFVEALKALGAAVSTNPSLPALSGVRLSTSAQGLVLEATDLEIAVQHHIEEVAGTADEAIVLSYKALRAAVTAFDGDTFEIHCDLDGWAELRCDGRRVRMRTMPTADFPLLPDCTRAWLQADAASLVASLARVAACASTDDARPVLTGVRLEAGSEGLEVVATDSYRLAYMKVPCRVADPSIAVLMPARFARAMAKAQRKSAGGADVFVSDGHMCFVFGATQYTCRLIDGEYMNWRQIVPARDGTSVVTFDASELVDGVRGVAAFATGSPVRLVCSTDGIEMAAKSEDFGDASQALTSASFEAAEGDGLTIGFNPAYLLDGLKFLGAGEVHMWARDGAKAVLFANGAPDDCFYLLMPWRLG